MTQNFHENADHRNKTKIAFYKRKVIYRCGRITPRKGFARSKFY